VTNSGRRKQIDFYVQRSGVRREEKLPSVYKTHQREKEWGDCPISNNTGGKRAARQKNYRRDKRGGREVYKKGSSKPRTPVTILGKNRGATDRKEKGSHLKEDSAVMPIVSDRREIRKGKRTNEKLRQNRQDASVGDTKSDDNTSCRRAQVSSERTHQGRMYGQVGKILIAAVWRKLHKFGRHQQA